LLNILFICITWIKWFKVQGSKFKDEHGQCPKLQSLTVTPAMFVASPLGECWNRPKEGTRQLALMFYNVERGTRNRSI
jgi:hypothetical protein